MLPPQRNLQNEKQHRSDSFFHRDDQKTTAYLSERQVVYPQITLSMSAEFQRLVSSYIIVKSLIKGEWIEIFRTESAPRTYCPVFIKPFSVIGYSSNYTKQKLRFDIYDDDTYGTWEGYLLGRVEVPVVEIIKQPRQQIMRGEDILGILFVNTKLYVTLQTVKMDSCDIEAFEETYPNEAEIRSKYPSFPFEVKTYDLTFSATDLCPNEDKILENGHLMLEVLVGGVDYSDDAGDLRRIWISNPIRMPYKVKRANITNLNRSTLLGRDVHDHHHHYHGDEHKKRLVFQVKHVRLASLASNENVKTRISTLQSYCSVSAMKIFESTELGALGFETSIERDFIKLNPLSSRRQSQAGAPHGSVQPKTTGPHIHLISDRSFRHTINFALVHLRDKVRKRGDKLRGRKFKQTTYTKDKKQLSGKSGTGKEVDDRKNLNASMPLSELLQKVVNYPTEDDLEEQPEDDTQSSFKSSTPSGFSEGIIFQEDLQLSNSAIDAGEGPTHLPKFGHLVLSVTKRTEINDVYPGEDNYERELKKIVKKQREQWNRNMYPAFDMACEEESDMAMKAVSILDGLSRGWRIKSCVIVDLNDLCIRNLKNKSGGTQHEQQPGMSMEDCNIYDVVECIHKLTSHFCTDNQIHAYAGGGVVPPSGHHPAVGYCRFTGFPLVQDSSTKSVLSHYWGACRHLLFDTNNEEVQALTADEDDDDDLDDDGSDWELDLSHEEQLFASDDEHKLLDIFPIPKVEDLDPGKLLRRLLDDDSINGWGGWDYGRNTSYKGLTALKQGLLEAASVYGPNRKSVEAMVEQRSLKTTKVKRFSFVGQDASLSRIFSHRLNTKTLRDDFSNTDIELLARLLQPSNEPKEVKVVTWVLGRCPPPEVLEKARVLMQYMSMKKGGPLALLVVLSSESGNHKEYLEGRSDAYPFQPFFDMLEVVLSNPSRVQVAEASVILGMETGLEPSASKIRYWKQQHIERHLSSNDVEYRTVVASPRLLVLHMLTWNEVMNKALCEDGHSLRRLCPTARDTQEMPNTGALIKQCSHIFKKMTLDRIQGELDPKKIPDYGQIRELRKRFEDAVKAHTSRRLNLFIHDVFHGAISENKLDGDKPSLQGTVTTMYAHSDATLS